MDSVCQEGKNIISNDQSEFAMCPTQRNNFDNELNNQGKRLLEISHADLRILNGRVDRVSCDSLIRKSHISLEKRNKCRLTTQYVIKIYFRVWQILLLKSRPVYQIIVQ